MGACATTCCCSLHSASGVQSTIESPDDHISTIVLSQPSFPNTPTPWKVDLNDDFYSVMCDDLNEDPVVDDPAATLAEKEALRDDAPTSYDYPWSCSFWCGPRDPAGIQKPQLAPTIIEEDELEDRPQQELADGRTYAGQWMGSARHGKGIQRHCEGQYEGDFKDDKVCGQGKFTGRGEVYDGQWLDGKAHGVGTHTDADGHSYTGQWVNNQKSGDGVQTWTNECVMEYGHGRKCYEGQFIADKRDGYGQMEWFDGSVYKGGYSKDLKSGEGTLRWPNGHAYEGQWLNGKQHGLGTVISPDGQKQRCHWNEGRKVPDPEFV